MKLRKKYKKDFEEIINDLISKGKTTAIISINLISPSKIKDHFLYDCILLDNGKVKEIPIVAIDVTQAIAKLEPYVDLGIPEATLKYMLGNERIQ